MREAPTKSSYFSPQIFLPSWMSGWRRNVDSVPLIQLSLPIFSFIKTFFYQIFIITQYFFLDLDCFFDDSKKKNSTENIFYKFFCWPIFSLKTKYFPEFFPLHFFWVQNFLWNYIFLTETIGVPIWHSWVTGCPPPIFGLNGVQ